MAGTPELKGTPTVTEAYSMIRVLRQRGAVGDRTKIAELQRIIDADRDKRAADQLVRFFPGTK